MTGLAGRGRLLAALRTAPSGSDLGQLADHVLAWLEAHPPEGSIQVRTESWALHWHARPGMADGFSGRFDNPDAARRALEFRRQENPGFQITARRTDALLTSTEEPW